MDSGENTLRNKPVLGHMVKILQLFGELQRNSGFDGMKC